MAHIYSFLLFLCVVPYSLSLSSLSFIFPSFPGNLENIYSSLKLMRVLHNSHLGATNQSQVCIPLLSRDWCFLHSSTNSQHEGERGSKAGLTHTSSEVAHQLHSNLICPPHLYSPCHVFQTTLLFQSRDFQNIRPLLLTVTWGNWLSSSPHW